MFYKQKKKVPTVLVMIKTNLNPQGFRKNCRKKQNCLNISC